MRNISVYRFSQDGRPVEPRDSGAVGRTRARVGREEREEEPLQELVLRGTQEERAPSATLLRPVAKERRGIEANAGGN